MTEEPKHPGGRPLKYQTVEELQAKVDEYFALRSDESGDVVKPVTVTGLALHLDMSREGLMNYGARDEFFDAIRRAKQRVEVWYEEHLLVGRATGPIFALKNFGWKDQSTLTVSSTPPTADEDRALLEEYARTK